MRLFVNKLKDGLLKHNFRGAADTVVVDTNLFSCSLFGHMHMIPSRATGLNRRSVNVMIKNLKCWHIDMYIYMHT